MNRLRLRIDFIPNGSLGPGKIQLLEAIRTTGSISAAARTLGMSYRRAWLLIDDLNRIFREPVVSAAVGGKHGGGSELTESGNTLIDQYRAIEREAYAAVAPRIDALRDALKPTPDSADTDAEALADDAAPAPGCAGRTSLARPCQR
ncbi:winged helix-turn-helix domain-containing protein [Azospirillum sp. TSO22-1]|uniref:winged helix-turn-helix domain-containing protein n=1 Tax=Azospirillum sp. TSO22-1 TaxID=716789 RepID=UPI000D60C172|nr:winged helix-turn-helix domain-containing protein [Azospirillum sp. TSO22-1]PWC32014.1 LysR family transcriptional regulator [Azospirillum sp. TSO22-1]